MSRTEMNRVKGVLVEVERDWQLQCFTIIEEMYVAYSEATPV